MNSKLKQAFNPEDFRNQAHALIDQLADYLDASQKQTYQTVIPYEDPNKNLALWEEDFKTTNADPSDFFKNIIERSTHLHHPKYMGHQVVPPLPLTVTTGILSSFLNNGMAVYEMGLASNPIERIVTNWLAQKVGFDKNSGGILTSGGTLANLTALLTARAKKVPSDVWHEGTQQKLAIMVSEEAHYCVDRAARIMGLGSAGIIKIPVDEGFRMKTDCLQTIYDEATAKGFYVFAIIGSASSTSTGAYENLHAIADFADQNNVWFHTDGAHGGAAVVSKKYKYLTAGIERADSVVIDFHKMMLLPALATAVLYKENDDAYATFQQKAQYLWANQGSQDWFNSGKRTFECTKLGMGIKVYSILKTYGEEIFEENVDTLFDLGSSFAKMIKANKNFELATEPDCNIVCFRFINTKENLNEFNSKVRAELLNKGDFYIVQTVLKEKLYLRVSLMNPFTTEQDLSELLHAIENIATTLAL